MTLSPPEATDSHDSAADWPGSWPARAWALALLGGVSGLLIFWIARPDRYLPNLDHTDLRIAASAFIFTGALLLGFLVERTRIGWTLGFALAGAALLAFTVYWNGPYGSLDDPWRIACAAIAVGIPMPLFQAWRGAQPAPSEDAPLRRVLPYAAAYRHAWTDVVLWFASWTFVGVVWAMALLLGQLFKLIGIRVLADVLGEEWMIFTLTGAALGAGVGLLRDRDGILALLQRVVTTILAVLAPLLAAGLLVFLLAIPFTGLAPLWDATRSTSPILLSCIIGALCLANAVIGEEKPAEARSPLLRAGVGALGAAMLPLALIAAFSTGLRIHQYGLTPDRLWAVIFTAIACAYGLAYFVTLAHRRLGAAPHLRAANLRLAIALAVLALVLATPLVNFGGLSARDQVARLEDGRTPLARFDWGALRFGFGRSGEQEVRRLAAKGKTPAIRAAAARALKEQSRWALTPSVIEQPPKPIDPDTLVVLPRGTKLPVKLLERLTDFGACYRSLSCAVIHRPGSSEAIVVTSMQSNLYRLEGGEWTARSRFTERDAAQADRVSQGLKAGKVEVRTVTRRQVYVDGVPVGSELE